MPLELTTPRLRLLPLNMRQLKLYLDNRPALAGELGFPVSESIINARVTRAINLKLGKMAAAGESIHPWLTYWLIVINATPFGAGLIGFKGFPDAEGKTEIGYGIDEAYQNRGYTTEAVQALTAWAFSHPECRALTAIAVGNPASARVLAKCGWAKVRQDSSGASDWELRRPD